MTEKPRFPFDQAFQVAHWLNMDLGSGCVRISIAGSLRRKKPTIGDIEILYVPNIIERPDPSDLFWKAVFVNLADQAIDRLLAAGVLKKRLTSKGSETWGALNKLAVHVSSGIPVDLFATTWEAWSNALVCRTGGVESNKRIAMAAQAKGWKWNPYGVGFSRGVGLAREVHQVTSEEDVFAFVGLPYLEPARRP